MRLPSHFTPRPRGAEADAQRADRVVADVAPFGEARRHVHLDPFDRQAVQRSQSRTPASRARPGHAGPAARRPWRAASAAPAPRSRRRAAACRRTSARSAPGTAGSVGAVVDRGHVDRDRQPEADHSGKRRITQPSTIAAPMNIAEHLRAERRLLPGRVLRDRREDQRDEEREQEHQAEVAGHLLAPQAHVVGVDRHEHVEQARRRSGRCCRTRTTRR